MVEILNLAEKMLQEEIMKEILQEIFQDYITKRNKYLQSGIKPYSNKILYHLNKKYVS